MTNDQRATSAIEALDALRERPDRREPSEVVRLAMGAGLPIPEVLREAQWISKPSKTKSLESVEVLSSFVCRICEASVGREILEYTDEVLPLTVGLAACDAPPSLTYVAPTLHVSKALQLAFSDTPVNVIRPLEIPPRALFSTIVYRPSPAPEVKQARIDTKLVLTLLDNLAPSGILIWFTGRGLLKTSRHERTLSTLASHGVTLAATIDVGIGWLPGVSIEGVALFLRRGDHSQRLIGTLRDPEFLPAITLEILEGPTRKSGRNWRWVPTDGPATFWDLEQQRHIDSLKPRGPCELRPLGTLLLEPKIQMANDALPQGSRATQWLYIPRSASGRVASDLREDGANPRSVFLLQVDEELANRDFLVHLLNSAYGAALRASVAHGGVAAVISASNLLGLELPVPSLTLQKKIARISGDIGIIVSALAEREENLGRNWSMVTELGEEIEKSKAVFDIEHLIDNWSTELPYPLAAIYRYCQVSTDPKDRVDALLHFFEMASIYFATVGVSYVTALRQDWESILSRLLYPTNAAGIKRADFGFWIRLAGASLKEVRRISSEASLRQIAMETGGPDLVSAASEVGQLSKTLDLLQSACTYRNNWKGHGGHIKQSDAERLEGQLRELVRGLYEICAPLFRRFYLVRPGRAEGTDTGMNFEVERLSGSDPAFEKITIEVDGTFKSGALAFWMGGTRRFCKAVHFFRLGAPKEPEEKSVYVFSRVENEGFRWISYQEAREQELIAPDVDLRALIELGKGAE